MWLYSIVDIIWTRQPIKKFLLGLKIYSVRFLWSCQVAVYSWDNCILIGNTVITTSLCTKPWIWTGRLQMHFFELLTKGLIIICDVWRKGHDLDLCCSSVQLFAFWMILASGCAMFNNKRRQRSEIFGELSGKKFEKTFVETLQLSDVIWRRHTYYQKEWARIGQVIRYNQRYYYEWKDLFRGYKRCWKPFLKVN